MSNNKMQAYIGGIISEMPKDWLKLTTHRLDIYNESLAKTEFLDHLDKLYESNDYSTSVLVELPTAYDYIRLGHPLSCVFEWAIAKQYNLKSDRVICFSSWSKPIMAILRKNHLAGIPTRIVSSGQSALGLDKELIRKVYQYRFEFIHVESLNELEAFEGITILVSGSDAIHVFDLSTNAEVLVNIDRRLGSVILMKNELDESYMSEVQHVRRRESIAMTPSDTLIALNEMLGHSSTTIKDATEAKKQVLQLISEITQTKKEALVGSSGLSIQYAIMMGLVDAAVSHHPDKAIKIIVPSNCYGGTNDQARRVAACNPAIEVVDWSVDAGVDMVESLDAILDHVASADAIPYIIAEIPTNPRVEVPDLPHLREVLTKERKTAAGNIAIEPVFILDQTFCPNVPFLADDSILSSVQTIAYVSGSKFPSGGRCTAGYCVANTRAEALLDKIAIHLSLCDNAATHDQIHSLAEQMPSMLKRIRGAYENTAKFVAFIKEKLPEAKINFVSDELAAQGFTPSVFSMDLPTQGDTAEEREAFKRAQNLKLINMMISEIPQESKFCVSYGQLKGCYWTIPATSTQGTTKEEDKDYIVRVSVSPALDLDKHMEVFERFLEG